MWRCYGDEEAPAFSLATNKPVHAPLLLSPTKTARTEKRVRATTHCGKVHCGEMLRVFDKKDSPFQTWLCTGFTFLETRDGATRTRIENSFWKALFFVFCAQSIGLRSWTKKSKVSAARLTRLSSVSHQSCLADTSHLSDCWLNKQTKAQSQKQVDSNNSQQLLVTPATKKKLFADESKVAAEAHLNCEKLCEVFARISKRDNEPSNLHSEKPTKNSEKASLLFANRQRLNCHYIEYQRNV